MARVLMGIQDAIAVSQRPADETLRKNVSA